MTYVAVVIADAQVARAEEIVRNLAYNLAMRSDATQGQVNVIRARVEQSHGTLRPVGTLHTVIALECPEGMDNCRNCGDPKTPCIGPNHCPYCGILHGCAPDRIVAQNGYKLIPVDGPIPDNKVWDIATESLVDR